MHNCRLGGPPSQSPPKRFACILRLHFPSTPHAWPDGGGLAWAGSFWSPMSQGRLGSWRPPFRLIRSLVGSFFPSSIGCFHLHPGIDGPPFHIVHVEHRRALSGFMPNLTPEHSIRFVRG